MGTVRWSPSDWAKVVASNAGKTVDQVFTAKALDSYLDPKGISIRESRDSAVNPNANGIIVGLDVTGSMGVIAHYMAKVGLGILFKEIYGRKPVTDPHILAMAIGDVLCDKAPLQVTQFEAGVTEVTSQLQKLYVEGGGGFNTTESYDFPWYFAATRTALDCFEKRGKKGYLFTIGDEEAPKGITREAIKKFLNFDPERDYSAADCYQMASRTYNVFHVLVEEGSHCGGKKPAIECVVNTWQPLIGQNLIRLSNYKNLAEVIVSAIQICEGDDKSKVVSSWDTNTNLVVGNALNALVPVSNSVKTADTAKSVVHL